MKQFQYWGPTNTKYQHTKFSHPSDQVPRLHACMA